MSQINAEDQMAAHWTNNTQAPADAHDWTTLGTAAWGYGLEARIDTNLGNDTIYLDDPSKYEHSQASDLRYYGAPQTQEDEDEDLPQENPIIYDTDLGCGSTEYT